MRSRWALTAVAVLLAALAPAAAAAAQDGCLSQLGITPDPGQAMPVILVHGFAGNPGNLESTKEAIDNANTDLAAYPFDYSQANTEWVDHPRIGPRLRQWIICLSDVSQDNDGIGRVAIVAHSMGGLAARHALAGDHEGEPMADRVALVATLGTPHLGAALAGPPDDGSLGGALARALFEIPGLVPVGPTADVNTPAARGLAVASPLLSSLPNWPAGLAVWAGAGQYIAEQRFLLYTREDNVGDLMVDVPSATALAPVADRLGGPAVDQCRLLLPMDLGPVAVGGTIAYTIDQDASLLDCYHGRLPGSQRLLDPLLAQLHAAAGRSPRASLIADGTGIAGVGLQSPALGLLDDLIGVLGAPDEDSGFAEIDCLPGDPARERAVRWGALTVTVVDDPVRWPDPVLSSWLLDFADGEPPDGVQVEPAIGSETTWEELSDLGATWDEFYDTWEAAGLFGELTSRTADPVATIAAVGAGATGIQGC